MADSGEMDYLVKALERVSSMPGGDVVICKSNMKLILKALSRKPAAWPWRTGEPPKDGSRILAIWSGVPYVVRWDRKLRSWWCSYTEMASEPSLWAQINLPEEVKT